MTPANNYPLKRLSPVVRGILMGVLVWMIYGTVEYLFSSVIAVAKYEYASFSSWHWTLTAELALAYAALGAGAGAVCGLLLGNRAEPSEWTDRRLQTAVTLTVALAFLLHAAMVPGSATERPLVLALALAISVVLALSLLREAWFLGVGRYLGPWVVSFLLVGSSWVARDMLRRSAAILGILVASVFWERTRFRQVFHSALARQAACVAVAMSLEAAGSLAFNHGLQPGERIRAQAGTADPPNIILITMDTVRADHLPLYGYQRNTTPNLALFSDEATLYRHVIAVSNMTLTTHASLFTGLYPGWHGAYFDPPEYAIGRPLAPSFPTVAGLLARHGYATMAVVANTAYLSPFFGLNRGFQVYDARDPVPMMHPDMPLFLRNGVRKLLGLFRDTSEFDIKALRAGEINHSAFALLDDARRQRAPFFLFVNYMDAHRPYVPPAPFDHLFPGKLKNFTDDRYDRLQEEVMQLGHAVAPREHQHLISQYDGAIAYMDDQLARLFRRLKRLGLYDNTLIIVTADHGENFGQRHALEHGISLYHEEVNVPLLVKYPHQEKRRTVDDLVSQIDIAPTILETAAVRQPASFAGQSLLHPIDPERCLYSEAHPSDLSAHWAPRFRRTQRAVYQGFQKFIESSTGERELYDLRSDPAEERNLYYVENGLAASMHSVLDGWASREPKLTGKGSAPAQVLQQLKSLGYIQ